MTSDEKETFGGDALVFRVGWRPLAVVAQLCSTAPRPVTDKGRAPFWSAWTGRLISTVPWGEAAVGSRLWLQLGAARDSGVAFVVAVIGPVPAPVPEAVAELLGWQAAILGPATWTSRGLLEHRSIAWVVGAGTPPFGPTGIPGPPSAGDREPRLPFPVAPAGSVAVDATTGI